MATSHGKGPQDGIGGAVKRFVRKRVLSENLKVTNAQEFCKAAKEMAKKTEVLLVKKSTIENSKKNAYSTLEKCSSNVWNKILTLTFL